MRRSAQWLDARAKLFEGWATSNRRYGMGCDLSGGVDACATREGGGGVDFVFDGSLKRGGIVVTIADQAVEWIVFETSVAGVQQHLNDAPVGG